MTTIYGYSYLCNKENINTVNTNIKLEQKDKEDLKNKLEKAS
jgi:hypothetical protein